MRNAFVYIIGWKRLNTYYGGVRYKEGCNPSDLWTLYFTSSKSVNRFRVEYGDPDIVRIIRTFGEDTISARLFEQRLLKKVNALNNERWLNKAIGGHLSGRRGPHSKETKRKMSEKAKDRRRGPVSEDQKQKQRETFMQNYEANREVRFAARSAKQKGRIISDEHRSKISATLTGTKLSDEVKRKIGEASKRQSTESRQKQAAALRGRRWFTDGQEVVRAYECPLGFRAGRK